MNQKTHGFVLLDVDVAALNNAGKNTSSNFDNAIATKKIFKNGKPYIYISGQAWRYWWRSTLQQNHGWQLSPIIRESKVAFTSANPIDYPDDDVFGYMKAAKEVLLDETGNIIMKNGKEVKEDVTVTRVSPLKNSAIVSVTATRPAENWSSMARQDGDSVPYIKEEYSAIMKGMFSIDLAQIGTFATYNKTGFKNLTSKIKEDALEKGATEIDDLFVKDSNGNAQKMVQLSKETRTKRIIDTLQALKTISGGAMQTSNMTDVTPKFIVLATMSTGNHPFSHIVSNEGAGNERMNLNIEGLKEVLKDYKDQFQGNVYIGRRNGFLEDYGTEISGLADLGKDHPTIEVYSINEAIDKYCAQLKDQIV